MRKKGHREYKKILFYIDVFICVLVQSQRLSRFTPGGAQEKVGPYTVLEIESGSATCKACVLPTQAPE